MGSDWLLVNGANFELFTHVTRFFGQKVILLGQYNGQLTTSADEPHLKMYVRESPGE